MFNNVRDRNLNCPVIDVTNNVCTVTLDSVFSGRANIDASSRVSYGVKGIFSRESFFAFQQFCHKEWKYIFTFPRHQESLNKIFEVAKRILIFAFLIVATPVSYLIAGLGHLVPKSILEMHKGRDPMVIGSGESATREITGLNLSAITNISLHYMGMLKIIPADNYSLKVTADSNLLDRLTATMRGQQLILKPQGRASFQTRTQVVYTLAMPTNSYNYMHVTGHANGTIINRRIDNEYQCQIREGGEININLVERQYGNNKRRT